MLIVPMLMRLGDNDNVDGSPKSLGNNQTARANKAIIKCILVGGRATRRRSCISPRQSVHGMRDYWTEFGVATTSG